MCRRVHRVSDERNDDHDQWRSISLRGTGTSSVATANTVTCNLFTVSGYN